MVRAAMSMASNPPPSLSSATVLFRRPFKRTPPAFWAGPSANYGNLDFSPAARTSSHLPRRISEVVLSISIPSSVSLSRSLEIPLSFSLIQLSFPLSLSYPLSHLFSLKAYLELSALAVWLMDPLAQLLAPVVNAPALTPAPGVAAAACPNALAWLERLGRAAAADVALGGGSRLLTEVRWLVRGVGSDLLLPQGLDGLSPTTPFFWRFRAHACRRLALVLVGVLRFSSSPFPGPSPRCDHPCQRALARDLVVRCLEPALRHALPLLVAAYGPRAERAAAVIRTQASPPPHTHTHIPFHPPLISPLPIL